jgi:hypothetical protein
MHKVWILEQDSDMDHWWFITHLKKSHSKNNERTRLIQSPFRFTTNLKRPKHGRCPRQTWLSQLMKDHCIKKQSKTQLVHVRLITQEVVVYLQNYLRSSPPVYNRWVRHRPIDQVGSIQYLIHNIPIEATARYVCHYFFHLSTSRTLSINFLYCKSKSASDTLGANVRRSVKDTGRMLFKIIIKWIAASRFKYSNPLHQTGPLIMSLASVSSASGIRSRQLRWIWTVPSNHANGYTLNTLKVRSTHFILSGRTSYQQICLKDTNYLAL